MLTFNMLLWSFPLQYSHRYVREQRVSPDWKS
jgi:hypothetical protein